MVAAVAAHARNVPGVRALPWWHWRALPALREGGVMARVGKAKRLRRQARIARRGQRRENYHELAAMFREHLSTHGLGGTVTVDETGVTISGGGAVWDCSKTGGVGISL